MKIDVSKCAFYNNGKCNNPNGMACNCCNNAYCYYKELQQLKAENEKLCTAIRNELPEQYDKRVSEAESDIQWGVLDRNATETEFCKNVIYETRNYIAKLEQENEELKNKLKMQKYKRIVVECGKMSFKNILHKYTLFQQFLDEIEHIIDQYGNNGIELSVEKQEQILQLIKQVKEGE